MKLFLFILALTFYIRSGNALSTVNTETANLAKSRLQESLSSFAKKMTISPEIIIPDPSDPTAILLQSTAVTNLSNALRSKAKSNAAFISGSLNAVKTFCTEQESARGNFPGPLPVVFCPSSSQDIDPDFANLAEAGVAGILYSTLNGKMISCAEEINGDKKLQEVYEEAIRNGMQIIPEVVLNSEAEWNEDCSKALIDSIRSKCGAEPAAILLTVGINNVDENEESTEQDNSILPKLPKCSTPILGSVRTVAGGGRMGSAVSAFKDSGFKGVVLRCDCLPGYRMNPDLDFVQGFWGAAISDLKSTKSKNFNFRSKVALERDIPMEWFNYQKNVMESGALGGNNSGENPLDTDSGDYQGF